MNVIPAFLMGTAVLLPATVLGANRLSRRAGSDPRSDVIRWWLHFLTFVLLVRFAAGLMIISGAQLPGASYFYPIRIAFPNWKFLQGLLYLALCLVALGYLPRIAAFIGASRWRYFLLWGFAAALLIAFGAVHGGLIIGNIGTADDPNHLYDAQLNATPWGNASDPCGPHSRAYCAGVSRAAFDFPSRVRCRLLAMARAFHLALCFFPDQCLDLCLGLSRHFLGIAPSLLPERPPHPIIVMNADLLTSVGFDHLLQFHADQGVEATMCAREFISQVPYGVIRFDGPRLTEIEEKPTQRYFVNAGIYALSPSVFDLIERDRPLDMPDLFSALIERKRSAAVFPIREYWMDIGRMDDLQRARDEFEGVFGS